MGQIEKEIDRARRNFARLLELELELTRARAGLPSNTAAAAYDVAIDGVAQAKVAIDQAGHELEVESGLYLDEEHYRSTTAGAPSLSVPEITPGPEVALLLDLRCPFCSAGSDEPHDWRCPKPGSTR